MDEDQAQATAQAIGGEIWQKACDSWVALKRRSDGCLVGISEEAVCEYASEQEFDADRPQVVISLM